MSNYVLVFLRHQNWILLIQKNKPEWQKGLLNGIGGKIEYWETAKQAAVREVEEETGIKLDFNEIRRFGYLRGKDWEVVCYKGFTDKILDAQTTTEEEVKLLSYSTFNEWKHQCIPNLEWILPAAFYKEHVDCTWYYADEEVEKPCDT